MPISLEDYRLTLLAAGMPMPTVAYVVSSSRFSIPSGQLALIDATPPRQV
ncbi:hypothetical protein HMJ29_15590 [Hymenobacter taeanensis]|uniref:Uncharacterized protein n=1 Tax=Hymenobacter taeanensis TaxID=2735321 RepID=A0A6M6BJP3_9BACT|nr:MULTISPECIES: hypothetical protein [Hymenobacter]QJX48272.1 hypothetical protein HMJ29_15590 [Hymenobacter taeanensis]UOQ82245.1 hypothetical protein MUN83_05605 [Hymenobacter sp. 5414T-23]